MKKEKCKKCGSVNITLKEYTRDWPEHYDGASEIICMDCNTRFGRWTGKELAPGEREPRYGEPPLNHLATD